MMKGRKIIIAFLLNLTLVLSAIFYAFLLAPNGLFAQSDCYVKVKSSGAVGDVYYPYSEYEDELEQFSVTLTIDYDFAVGDTIVYYYLKTDSISVKYQTIKSGSEAIKVVTDENKLTAGEIQVFPYKLGGIGTYNIFAIIQDVYKGTEIKADAINLVLEKPLVSNLKLEIMQPVIIKGESNELPTYFLQAKVTLNKKPVNSDDYVIYWYFIDQRNYPISNKSAFYWKPAEVGNYTFIAEIKGAEVVSNTYPIPVTYNQTEIIMLCILGIGVVMTLFVVVTTIIKVKSERVW